MNKIADMRFDEGYDPESDSRWDYYWNAAMEAFDAIAWLRKRGYKPFEPALGERLLGAPIQERQIVPASLVDEFAGVKCVYELTLTIPPNAMTPVELYGWLDRIATSRTQSCVGYVACMELTKAGIPHIHAMLFTSKYVDKSKVTYPHRFEFKKVRSVENYLIYIQKCLDDPDIQAYCQQHGVPQYKKQLINAGKE